jgi:hypothetical protein
MTALAQPAPPSALAQARRPEPSLRDKRRSLRVIVLVVAIALMSLGDLVMTLEHLKTIGMGEANPIARYIIGYNSPALLAAWKIASIALASIIFLRYRARPTAELACWLCTAVLAVLTCMWLQYASEIHTLTCSLPAVADSQYSAWVHISAD